MGRKTRLSHYPSELLLFQKRLLNALFIIWICFGVLIARLYYLQIIEHEQYATQSNQNRLELLPIPPARGLIYDRRGRILADNVPTYGLYIVPEQVENLEKTVTQLSKILHIGEEAKQVFYRHLKHSHHFEHVPLLLKLTEEDAAKFAVEAYRFPGVEMSATLLRNYPYGESLSHAIGYVGRISEEELKQIDQTNYSGTLLMGKIGIEKFYENALHGHTGVQHAEIDARGRVIRIVDKKPPTHGVNLHLTIDARLQAAAIKALGTKNGAIIALDPNNGNVLALVSAPSFDPNAFAIGIETQQFQALQNAPSRPLYNRAIRGQYPPASTIKPLMAIQALATNTITPSFSIEDPGYYQLENTNQIYRDWIKGGHGHVDLYNGIVQSCDTYFYTVAHMLGIDAIAEIMHAFGYGKILGIDLTGELGGNVATPAWKRKVHHQPWYPGETIITGIGQGYTVVTPLQLAHAAATFAMQGKRFRPHLLDYIETIEGEKIPFTPEPLPDVPIANEGYWTFIRRAMLGVTTDPNGTASYLSKSPYKIAGKSGTAQVFSLARDQEYNASRIAEHLRDHSLFLAYAPVDNPQIAIAVVTENSKGAVLIGGNVIDAYLSNETITTVPNTQDLVETDGNSDGNENENDN